MQSIDISLGKDANNLPTQQCERFVPRLKCENY